MPLGPATVRNHRNRAATSVSPSRAFCVSRSSAIQRYRRAPPQTRRRRRTGGLAKNPAPHSPRRSAGNSSSARRRWSRPTLSTRVRSRSEIAVHREGDRERGPNLLPLSVLVDQGERRSPDPGGGAHYLRNDPARYPCPVAQVYLGVGRARERGHHDEATE